MWDMKNATQEMVLCLFGYKIGAYPFNLLRICKLLLCNSAIKWVFVFKINPYDADLSYKMYLNL